MTTLSSESASRTGSIDEIRRALREARSGADVDEIERRLDALQAELRARWTGPEATEPLTATA
jgi:hypothetical protein